MIPEQREDWLTIGEGAAYLGIADKTLRKYLRQLEMKPIPHRGDQRRHYYSRTMLNQLAQAKGLTPGQKPPTLRRLALEVRDLRHEVEELRAHLAKQAPPVERAAIMRPPTSPRPAPTPGPTLWQFVERHISAPMDVSTAVRDAQAALGSRRTSQEVIGFSQRTKLVQQWKARAGYHQCKEDLNCPCHRLLPE